MIKSLLRKLIPKNLAGIVGLIQSALPLIREFLMVITRICAVLIPGNKDDLLVEKIGDFFDGFEEIFEKIKDFFLEI